MDTRYRTSGHLHLSARRKRRRATHLKAYWQRHKKLKYQEEETLEELVVETEHSTNAEEELELSGRRIVDINFFVKELQDFNRHSNLGCDISDTIIKSEIKQGFKSCILFECKMCHTKKNIWTEDPKNKAKSINSDIVAGIISIGSGFSHMDELFSTLDIPTMSMITYLKEQEKHSRAWELAAEEEMKLAAEEEKKIAVERGEVEPDGTPLLTVIADGSWAKRSYRSNFSSLSGSPKGRVSIRSTTLATFRDVIALAGDIEGAVRYDRSVSPGIKHMILILQSVNDSYPPNKNKLRIENLAAQICDVYLGYYGLYENGDLTVTSSEPMLAGKRRPSADAGPRRISRPFTVQPQTLDTLDELFKKSVRHRH